MGFDKSSAKYRYIFDIDRGTLHDLKSEFNKENRGCDLSSIENWVVFDTERVPIKGALIKKLTSTREVVDIEVTTLCPHCLKAEDDELVSLLQDYFLSQNE